MIPPDADADGHGFDDGGQMTEGMLGAISDVVIESLVFGHRRSSGEFLATIDACEHGSLGVRLGDSLRCAIALLPSGISTPGLGGSQIIGVLVAGVASLNDDESFRRGTSVTGTKLHVRPWANPRAIAAFALLFDNLVHFLDPI